MDTLVSTCVSHGSLLQRHLNIAIVKLLQSRPPAHKAQKSIHSSVLLLGGATLPGVLLDWF